MRDRRTIVFDVGGVIVRWQPGELMRACFPSFEHRAWSGRHGVVKPERAIFDQCATRWRSRPRSYGWNALRFENPAQCEAALVDGGWP